MLSRWDMPQSLRKVKPEAGSDRARISDLEARIVRLEAENRGLMSLYAAERDARAIAERAVEKLEEKLRG